MNISTDADDKKLDSTFWKFEPKLPTYLASTYQRDQMAKLFLNIWPFTTMKICPQV